LKQQLEIERRIVPDEKEVDNFMRMVSEKRAKSEWRSAAHFASVCREEVLHRSAV